MAVFNDNPEGKRRRLRLGYGTAKKARNSVRKLRRQPRQYQVQAAHTLYYRAKFHKYQTQGMRNAAKIYKNFLEKSSQKSKRHFLKTLKTRKSIKHKASVN